MKKTNRIKCANVQKMNSYLQTAYPGYDPALAWYGVDQSNPRHLDRLWNPPIARVPAETANDVTLAAATATPTVDLASKNVAQTPQAATGAADAQMYAAPSPVHNVDSIYIWVGLIGGFFLADYFLRSDSGSSSK